MKKLSLAFILALSFTSAKGLSAMERISVESLAEGACWLHSEERSTHLVSFNEKKSFILEAFAIEKLFERELQLSREDLQGLKTYIHCSAMGLSLVFNFQTESGGRCLWSSLGEESELVRGDFGHNDSSQTGFCDGAKMGELIVLSKGSAGKELLEQALFDLTGPQAQASVQEFATGVYKVILPGTFYGQEGVIREKLLAHPGLIESVRTIEFAPFYHPIGEVRELLQFGF